MKEPNWITIVFIGALGGYLLPYLTKALFYLKHKFQQSIIEGKWYHYHITNQGGHFRLYSSIWNIRKGYDSRFTVEEYREGIVGPAYKDHAYFEGNFLLVRLGAVRHEEEVSIRLLNPVPPYDNLVWGLGLAIDFHRNSMAYPCAISREEISSEDASKFILSKIKVYTNVKTLIVPSIIPSLFQPQTKN